MKNQKWPYFLLHCKVVRTTHIYVETFQKVKRVKKLKYTWFRNQNAVGQKTWTKAWVILARFWVNWFGQKRTISMWISALESRGYMDRCRLTCGNYPQYAMKAYHLLSLVVTIYKWTDLNLVWVLFFGQNVFENIILSENVWLKSEKKFSIYM